MYLKHLIIQHHSLFTHLLPDKKLLQNHNFMVDFFPMQKIRPLLHSLCMHYEAKYNLFKKQLKSFKNIMKTLPKNHPCLMASMWQTFDPNDMKLGPDKMAP